MKISKSELKKIKETLIKLPRVLGEHAFLSFLGLLFLSLLFGGFLFYKYDVLAKKERVEVFIKHSEFNEDGFRKTLKEWEEREKRFKEAESKEYPNPFQKSLISPIATSSVPAPTEELSM